MLETQARWSIYWKNVATSVVDAILFNLSKKCSLKLTLEIVIFK